MSDKEKVAYLCREWWWSPSPFWNYLNSAGQGWANFIEIHPGSFNLAWVSAGGPHRPPGDYTAHAAKVQWVLAEAHHIPVGPKTLADWAFEQDLPTFYRTCCNDPLLQVWSFMRPDMTYGGLLRLLQRQLARHPRA